MTLSCVLKVSKLDYRAEMSVPLLAPHLWLYLYQYPYRNPEPFPFQNSKSSATLPKTTTPVAAAAVDDHYFSWRRYICSASTRTGAVALENSHLCVCPSSYTLRNFILEPSNCDLIIFNAFQLRFLSFSSIVHCKIVKLWLSIQYMEFFFVICLNICNLCDIW